MMTALAHIAEETGQPAMWIMRDVAALSFGPGRITFGDYVRMRLYDEVFWAGADRRAVAGRRRAREIAGQLNGLPPSGARGFFANPLASGAYLAAFGFPTAEVEAVYAPDLAAPGRRLLKTRDQLRDFLEGAGRRPFWGRPLAGEGGEAYAAEGAETFVVAGRTYSADAFIDHIADNCPAGYVFERRPPPAPAVEELTGEAAGRLRLVTVATDQGPKLLRACWRIPDGAGGEILMRLDARTGEVVDGLTGEGFDMRRVARHPATGRSLWGASIPDWSHMRAMASEAARLFPDLALAGLDMAATAEGPMILGVDSAPDLVGHQLIDRRGILNPDFQAFVAARREDAALIGDLARAEG
ncbi:MAG TPA: sugar-transfer associated ATP-grasp domain-containing protein [Caulobacteraceae bacterium]|nr:sugar-transfer associated ATP-grasp domain-containing protein [Caulobacteraceae bacterium]